MKANVVTKPFCTARETWMKNTQTLIVRKNTWTKKHRKTWIKNTQTSIVRKSQKLCWLKNSRKKNHTKIQQFLETPRCMRTLVKLKIL